MSKKTSAEWFDSRESDIRIKTPEGYILVYCPLHPYAKSKGHVYEHRYLMEKHLKRFLLPSEHVHHINGIRDDSKIENMMLMTPSQHSKEHQRRRTPDQVKRMLDSFTKATHERHEQFVINHPKITIYCACGCGQQLENRDNRLRLRRFIHGHNGHNKQREENLIYE